MKKILYYTEKPLRYYLIFTLSSVLLILIPSCKSVQPPDEKVLEKQKDTALSQQNRAIPYSTSSEKNSFFAPAVRAFIKKGGDSAWIARVLADNRTNFIESLVKINVTGALSTKKADYSHNYSPESVREVKKLLRKNDSLFEAIEAKFGVEKEAIAAILWVETKFGKITGNHHVVSAYLSIALVAEPEFIKKNKQVVRADQPTVGSDILDSLDKKIEQRAQRKSSWAVGELLALQKMEGISPVPVLDIKGSWAGAFGWSQFIPSSYISWAKDGNSDGKIDLFSLNDAAASVANYLKQNGWSKSHDSHKKAVHHYNNSDDYVFAVLTLAQKLAEK